MAAKITLLRTDPLTFSSVQRLVLYWYSIVPRIQDSLGLTIVPQNRNGITPASNSGDSPLPYLTATDLDALDAGDAGYEILRQTQTAGETIVQFRNRLLADHAVRQAAWVQARRDQYAAAGNTAN